MSLMMLMVSSMVTGSVEGDNRETCGLVSGVYIALVIQHGFYSD
jgi:hypothetical protein